jgi:malonyl CoA-acyl carrier protein transacylase
MAAVIGMRPDQIAETLAASEAGQRIDVANFNSPEQTVIAGLSDDLRAVQPAFESAGARAFIPLKVSAPFHSRYMRDPMLEFATVLGPVPFAPLAIPVIANATGEPYPQSVRETLATQIGHAVRWLDSMTFLLDRGVSEFEEVGPGKVLTKLLVQVKKARV